jgi:hypothetical protein
MNSALKKLIAIGLALPLTLAGPASFAQTTTQPPGAPAAGASGGFAAHQQKELANIAQRIQILQTLQTCVQAATDHNGLKTCHETAKQSEQSLHH